MSLEKAKKYLQEKGYADHIIELADSSPDFLFGKSGLVFFFILFFVV